MMSTINIYRLQTSFVYFRNICTAAAFLNAEKKIYESVTCRFLTVYKRIVKLTPLLNLL